MWLVMVLGEIKTNGENAVIIKKDLDELKNKHTETNNTVTEIKKHSRRNQ